MTDQTSLVVQPAENKVARNIPGARSSSLRRPPQSNPNSLLNRVEDKVPKLVTVLNSTARSRIRSASAGRDRKSDLQARYWGLLFENLRRAVDEIYGTCESDESIEECKEAIMILESCTKDFRNLIEWLRLKWNYEQTPPPQRPTSLAWEVRKSSPIKPSCASLMGHLQKTPVGLARRILNFNEDVAASVTACPVQPTGFPIQTILEANDETSSANQNTARLAKVPPVAIPIGRPKTALTSSAGAKTSEPVASRLTSKSMDEKTKPLTVAVSSKPKTFKLGNKAGKNAANSEVQSLGNKVVATSDQRQPTSTKVPAQTQQSWAQRLQGPQGQSKSVRQLNGPKSTAGETRNLTLPRTDPAKKMDKPTTPRSVQSAGSTTPRSPAPQPDQDGGGWETVRGRTRSRTSPAKSATVQPTLMRASTMIYTSRAEASKHSASSSNGSGTLQQKRRSKLLKPATAQSLPSLCDRPKVEEIKCFAPIAPSPSPPPPTPVLVVVTEPVPALVDITTDEETDEAGEEAEMARREEALTAEEEHLQREMRETERSDNEADELWEDPITVTPASTPEGIPLDLETLTPERVPVERDLLEEKYHLLLQNCSWADQMDLLDQLQEVAALDGGARQPGRALQVHEKLSSPSRRRMAEPCQAYEQHEAKQRRAREHRAALQEERARKRHELTKRMTEVRQAKSLLLIEKKQLLERKMARAEAKRMQHLADIVKKAHDEEEKKKEIAFINSMEAQNKRHDFIAHIQTQEERIQGLQEERARRQEEKKLAKEAAVEERKRALEAERLAKMALLQEKRRQRELRIDREHQEKEKERLELARARAVDREERLSALQAAHQASQFQLERKIRQKQEESARRHEENIEQIRQRALELSILRFSSAGGEEDADESAPPSVHYDTARKCSLCGVAIQSEVVLMSHLRGRKHREALKLHYGGKEPSREQSERSNLKFIVDAGPSPTVSTARAGTKQPVDKDDDSNKCNSPVEETEKEKRAKALKKRVKKIRSKVMQAGSNAAEAALPVVEGSNRHRIARILQDLERDPTGNDRQWNELVRLLEKGASAEQLVFASQRGLVVVTNVLTAIPPDTQNIPVHSRILVAAANAVRLAARSQTAISALMVNSRIAPLLLGLIAQRLEALEADGIQTAGQAVSDNIAAAAMNAWAAIVDSIVSGSSKDKETSHQPSQELNSRLMNLASYAVALGLVDGLSRQIGDVRGPDPSGMDLLLSGLKFLTSLADLLQLTSKKNGLTSKKSTAPQDPTGLIEAFQATELAGVVNALYGLLLHGGVQPSAGRPAPQMAEPVARFTLSALQLLHRLALFDLKSFQAIVGAEGVSLEFRHIASFLLHYGVVNNSGGSGQHLLNLTILCVGYFATGHQDNQMILQSGHMPSVLQQLCRLPFAYFSDRSLRAILLPTLLACCHDNPANRLILQKEMSYQMLDDFVNSDDGRAVHLVQTVLQNDTKPL